MDFNAKNEYDMINNYKVLQDVFNKLGVDKVSSAAYSLVDVFRLLSYILLEQHTSGWTSIIIAVLL